MFKPCDLVRVRDSALEGESRIPQTNRNCVKSHGYLWLVMAERIDNVYCKSLATGDDNGGEGWLWFDQELEKADV